MMISGIVSDDNHSAPGSDAGAAKAFHESKEGRAIEFVRFPAEPESPVRNRTAPKYPTLRRVGACSKTGSLVSGGIHIWQREPCCWKCTSSVAQRSTVSSCISVWSFFYAPSAGQDRLAQCWGAACAAESPTAGTRVGTDALPSQSHTLPQSRPPRSCRPIESRPIPYRGASGEERH